MTLQELSALIDGNPLPMIAFFTAIPMIIWVAGLIRGNRSLALSPIRWVYSVALYAVFLPGLIALLLLTDRIAHGSLMQVDLVTQIVPFVSMLVTFFLIIRAGDPGDIPGFRRVTGFLGIVAMTTLALFMLMKTRVWIMFGGGIGTLLAFMAGFLLLLKWLADRTFGSKQ